MSFFLVFYALKCVFLPYRSPNFLENTAKTLLFLPPRAKTPVLSPRFPGFRRFRPCLGRPPRSSRPGFKVNKSFSALGNTLKNDLSRHSLRFRGAKTGLSGKPARTPSFAPSKVCKLGLERAFFTQTGPRTGVFPPPAERVWRLPAAPCADPNYCPEHDFHVKITSSRTDSWLLRGSPRPREMPDLSNFGPWQPPILRFEASQRPLGGPPEGCQKCSDLRKKAFFFK